LKEANGIVDDLDSVGCRVGKVKYLVVSEFGKDSSRDIIEFGVHVRRVEDAQNVGDRRVIVEAEVISCCRKIFVKKEGSG